MQKFQIRNSNSDLLREKLEKGHLIRPFPGVVSQLLAAFDDPNADARTFARIVEADAALSARILRMANSPIYGFSNVIRSIDHAVTILGIVPLRNLALTFAGATVFSGGEDASRYQESLWNHSLGCATVARLLAKFVAAVNHDEAFLAGIFHDVGKLFFYDVAPKEYAKLVGASWGSSLVELEQEQFGLTHEEVGARLTTGWKLPEQIMVVVGYHHRPEEAIAHQNLTALIQIADGLARAGGIGSSGEPGIDVSEAASEYLGLEASDLEAIQQQSLLQFEESRQVFVS